MNVAAVIHDTDEVVGIGPAGLDLPGRVTTTGLELPDGLSFDEWRSIGDKLQSVERSLMWWIGDWLRYGEKSYGSTYTQAVESTGKAYQTVAHAKHVAEQFGEIFRRRKNLSFSHHAEVASLDIVSADRLLDEAERNNWSRNELRRRVGQVKNAAKLAGATLPGADGTCTIADLHRVVEMGITFGCIYADPPWLYDNQGTRAATENHYGGMTVEELCELPVHQLAAKDAHLHLWTTNAFLFDCPRIFDAWGFEFKSSFTWCKPQMGIGNYWRNSHEILLTAVRGDAKRFNDHGIMSWILADRTAHSAKPEQVRGFIERASDGPYLELFARRIEPKWAAWGNQIERTMFDRAVEEIG